MCVYVKCVSRRGKAEPETPSKAEPKAKAAKAGESGKFPWAAMFGQQPPAATTPTGGPTAPAKAEQQPRIDKLSLMDKAEITAIATGKKPIPKKGWIHSRLREIERREEEKKKEEEK